MKITFLGTGTSHGIPQIACDCPVCTSSNPKNNRTRSSIYIESSNKFILIDTTTDFRFQAIREKIKRVDCVLYTHSHADHINGFDDIRVFSDLQNEAIELYGSEKTMHSIRERFDYCFNPPQIGGGIPNVNINILNNSITIGDMEIQPIPVFHGILEVYGYRINNFAYLTDCSLIPEKSYEKLKNLDVLVLNTLRYTPHPTHFSLSESIREAQKIGAKRTYFVHMCHQLEHKEVNNTLPPSMELAYDGLKLTINY